METTPHRFVPDLPPSAEKVFGGQPVGRYTRRDQEKGGDVDHPATTINFRLPGPTPLPPPVLAAMQRPMIPHRGPEFRALYSETLAMARAVHRTEHPVLLWPATGSAGWEMAIVNLLSPGDPVLAAVCGDFGERFARVGVALGLDVRRLDVPWGHAVEPEPLRGALQANPDVKAVFLTHNETSTGVTTPLQELASVVREHGALIVVDSVSGVGALPLEMDTWGLDFVLSGSQKAWMCPPGLLIAAIGPRAWDAVERSGYPRFFWDIEAARASAEQGMTPTTPPLTLIYAVRAALEMILHEGIDQVWDRHRRLGEQTRAGISAAGLRLFAAPGRASDSVTAFLPPPGVSASTFLDLLRREHGVEAQGGQGHLADSLLRIGHMGWAHEAELGAAVDAVAHVAADVRACKASTATR
ncbi:MAG TPA: alanine--glyoxylate aminotransferase family protein [Thermomicrobiales bacterium]|nr:alanine--glyoxylate aminotransferase family protein [Thermomicrobiales bacterium]